MALAVASACAVAMAHFVAVGGVRGDEAAVDIAVDLIVAELVGFGRVKADDVVNLLCHDDQVARGRGDGAAGRNQDRGASGARQQRTACQHGLAPGLSRVSIV
jgi:hypothetical protein